MTHDALHVEQVPQRAQRRGVGEVAQVQQVGHDARGIARPLRRLGRVGARGEERVRAAEGFERLREEQQADRRVVEEADGDISTHNMHLSLDYSTDVQPVKPWRTWAARPHSLSDLIVTWA